MSTLLIIFGIILFVILFHWIALICSRFLKQSYQLRSDILLCGLIGSLMIPLIAFSGWKNGWVEIPVSFTFQKPNTEESQQAIQFVPNQRDSSFTSFPALSTTDIKWSENSDSPVSASSTLNEKTVIPFWGKINLSQVLLVSIGTIWLGGLLICLLKFLVGCKRLKQLSFEPIGNQSIQAEIESFSNDLNLPSTPNVMVLKGEHPPFVFGLFKPVIVLPQKLITRLSPTEIRAILLHEWTHVIQKDLWFELLMQMVQVLYWWNPLTYKINTELRETREILCDLKTAEQMEPAADYAATLVDLLEKFHRPVTGFPGMAQSKSLLKQRIEMLLKRRTEMFSYKSNSLVRVGIFCLSLVFVLSSGVRFTNAVNDEGDAEGFGEITEFEDPFGGSGFGTTVVKEGKVTRSPFSTNQSSSIKVRSKSDSEGKKVEVYHNGKLVWSGEDLKDFENKGSLSNYLELSEGEMKITGKSTKTRVSPNEYSIIQMGEPDDQWRIEVRDNTGNRLGAGFGKSNRMHSNSTEGFSEFEEKFNETIADMKEAELEAMEDLIEASAELKETELEIQAELKESLEELNAELEQMVAKFGTEHHTAKKTKEKIIEQQIQIQRLMDQQAVKLASAADAKSERGVVSRSSRRTTNAHTNYHAKGNQSTRLKYKQLQEKRERLKRSLDMISERKTELWIKNVELSAQKNSKHNNREELLNVIDQLAQKINSLEKEIEEIDNQLMEYEG